MPTTPPGPAVAPAVLEIQDVLHSLTETQLLLQRLAGRLLTEGVLEHETRRKNAASQRASADTLRNKAARLPAGEHQDELCARADRFERRAAVIDAGKVMPRELRYPLDSLRLVAAAREKIAAALLAIDELEAEEVSLFVSSLQDPTPQDEIVGPASVQVEAPAMLLRNEIGEHLGMLGGYVDSEGNLRLQTFALAVAVAPQPSPPASTNGAPEAPAPALAPAP